MKKIKSIKTHYYRGYGRCLREFEETDVDISTALKRHKSSTIYKSVKALVDAGALRVTVSSVYHPESRQLRYDIYTGYRK